MPRAVNAYSQFIALTKIILPMVGLGLLSSLFLLSNQDREVGELPYSEVELQEIAESQEISGPVFRTKLENGASVHVHAKSARPILTEPGTFRAVDISGVVTTPSGAEITLDGGVALLNQNTQTATVEDGLRILHSDGYSLSAKTGSASLDGKRATSEGDVVLHRDGINITAAQAEFLESNGEQSQVVVFSGGVRVLYTPQ